jgi:hypothetical protein
MCQIRVLHAKSYLELKPETAEIKVDRTEQRYVPVNYSAFGV